MEDEGEKAAKERTIKKERHKGGKPGRKERTHNDAKCFRHKRMWLVSECAFYEL